MQYVLVAVCHHGFSIDEKPERRLYVLDKRLARILEPGFGMYFIVFLVFACVSAFFSLFLALFEMAVCAALYIYYVVTMRRRNQEVLQYLRLCPAEPTTRQDRILLTFQCRLRFV